MYHLGAVAEDKTGILSRQEIQIAVGDVSDNSEANWKHEINQVILNEGERMMGGEVREFPRLECKIKLHPNGKLVLINEDAGLIGGSWSKDEDDVPHDAVLAKGQLVTYRGTPDRPEATLWESRKPKDKGPYKLGITASRRLAVFRDEGKRPTIVWMSPVQN
jgi:hypothetical protein